MTTTPDPRPAFPAATRLARSLTVTLPPRWRRRSDAASGLVVAARSPGLPASGVRPEIVVRCVPAPDVDLHTWRTDALHDLADVVVDLHLEDEDTFVDRHGREVAYRRFAHRVAGDDLVCDQWAWLYGDAGVTVTCSAARSDYLAHADLFELVADGVEPTELAADRMSDRSDGGRAA